jgi:hypothetical protein
LRSFQKRIIASVISPALEIVTSNSAGSGCGERGPRA